MEFSYNIAISTVWHAKTHVIYICNINHPLSRTKKSCADWQPQTIYLSELTMIDRRRTTTNGHETQDRTRVEPTQWG